MKLYSGKVKPLARALVSTLLDTESIDVDDRSEVELDFEAVLKEYLRMEREVGEEARRLLERRGLGYQQLGRVRNEVAKRRNFSGHEQVLPYLLQQLIDMLFHSRHVEEVYATDTDLREQLVPVLRKHLDVEAELEEAIQARLKNVKEGTPEYEVEYARVAEQVKRSLGLR